MRWFRLPYLLPRARLLERCTGFGSLLAIVVISMVGGNHYE